ncbi:hypothetical protein ATE92_2517 [Ulvibacter sp. MAR_2010_11]|uniref:hypothetical protein n=1 Tax=Ulvibacter sp. MAR_2010_11 TaxID=1250229 RepID=UPI000C2B5A25|nr:hypothetical protein [Ulvibacter sp. MAR_2010_11]PKA84330.1 hypothetical protein ATE92_2517 [Ulvibacter sp. MAR_2010_11]
MQRNFIKYLLLFFIPLLLGYATIEYLTLQLPSGYEKNKTLFQDEGDTVEVLVLGSSQLNNAVNPALLKYPTLNLASGDQHHNTDFKLLKALLPKLSNLNTIVLEVSYSHFELPHNSPDFWKNSVYLKYYSVNCFERTTYFKDKLIYLSFPAFYSEKIHAHYIAKSEKAAFNRFGFDTLNYEGRFKTLNYNEAKIDSLPRFKINKQPNPEIFKTNTALFYELLDYLKANHLNVIICQTPMYKAYLPQRNSEILQRRDSVLTHVAVKYSNVHFLNTEEDTLHFKVRHYWNESHLNPDGAATFTAMLQQKLDSLH